jgi:hypothetical protein
MHSSINFKKDLQYMIAIEIPTVGPLPWKVEKAVKVTTGLMR